jgi:hypothetical protein
VAILNLNHAHTVTMGQNSKLKSSRWITHLSVATLESGTTCYLSLYCYFTLCHNLAPPPVSLWRHPASRQSGRVTSFTTILNSSIRNEYQSHASCCPPFGHEFLLFAVVPSHLASAIIPHCFGCGGQGCGRRSEPQDPILEAGTEHGGPTTLDLEAVLRKYAYISPTASSSGLFTHFIFAIIYLDIALIRTRFNVIFGR